MAHPLTVCGLKASSPCAVYYMYISDNKKNKNSEQKGKSGILEVYKQLVGALSLSGELDVEVMKRSFCMSDLMDAYVTNDDKLDLLLLVRLEELLQILPEQATDYHSHIEKLDQHFQGNCDTCCRSGSTPNGDPVQETKGRYFSLTNCRHRPGQLAQSGGTRHISTRTHAQL